MKTLFSLKSSARMEDIMDKHITTPITEEVTKDLKSGDYVYITGTIYAARDAAHKRMIEALQRGQYHLLYGSISGARGQTDRFCRTDHSHPHGQICTDTA